MNTVSKIFLISLTIAAGTQAEDAKKLKPEIAAHNKMSKAYINGKRGRVYTKYGTTKDPEEKLEKNAVWIVSPFKKMSDDMLNKMRLRDNNPIREAQKMANETDIYMDMQKANLACRCSDSMESKECSKFHELEKEFLATKEGKELATVYKDNLYTHLMQKGSERAYFYGTQYYTLFDIESAIRRGINNGLGYDNDQYSIGHTAEIYKKAKADLNKMADDICYEQQ